MTAEWGLWALCFGSIFIAELPDKTSVVVMTLAQRGALRVWLGAVIALGLQAALAVAVGAVLAGLVGPWLHWGEAAVFLVFGVMMLKNAARQEDVDVVAGRGWSLALTAFVLVFVAEFGDLTQMAVVAWSARLGPPVAVWAVSAMALAVAAAASAVGGTVVARAVGARRLHQASGVLFLAIAIVMAAA
jgi:putative Ca2+/H+ antiporter (TMEM165/GDT1 family)